MRDIAAEIRSTVVPPGAVAIWWLGQFSFVGKGQGRTLGFDLYLSDYPGNVTRSYPPPVRPSDLRGLDLSDAYLRQADLRGVDLRETRLEGASLFEARISGAYFPGELRAEEITLSLLHGTRLRYG